ncbi:class F sortase [Pseudarthrobacter raffinosi]|uniref:class F sortase n=1 Tax=Pseudarthrobacter raffinosi TaxID=2953651 RepID=UPI00208E34D0|nr:MULTISPECIES: class F sortase [unclassified Pseudarthrobacter]MCO4252951.1 sortase [Pseudarthrobacter sp. MDT3-9]MCO4265307.1 sortase [Pseudarthrobacter sp. MDT3-26]
MTPKNPGHRKGPLAATAAGVLLLLTLAGCAGGPASTPDSGPAPATSASSTAAPSTPAAPFTPPPAAPAAAPAAQQLPPVLGASAPVTLAIPSIGVRTDLLHLGLEENGSLKVPEDTGKGTPGSWYDGSPTPGQRGPSVILGHVNALGGNKGVFADLRKLTPGAEINVSRADGSTAVFAVDRGALYPKNEFPTVEVYGNTDGAEIRLITCDGYDPATGLFDDNYVIYATLKA